MDVASHSVPDGSSHWEASEGRVTLCQLPALQLTLTGAMHSGWVPAMLLQGLWLPLPTAVKGGTMGPSRPVSQKSILGCIPLVRCFPRRGQPGPRGPRGGGSTPPPPPAPPHGGGGCGHDATGASCCLGRAQSLLVRGGTVPLSPLYPGSMQLGAAPAAAFLPATRLCDGQLHRGTWESSPVSESCDCLGLYS